MTHFSTERPARTHWHGCETVHHPCAVARIDSLRAELLAAKAEHDRLQAVNERQASKWAEDHAALMLANVRQGEQHQEIERLRAEVDRLRSPLVERLRTGGTPPPWDA